MTRWQRYLGVVFLGFVMSGCAESIQSDVTRFHQLSRPAGETVEIVAKDPEKQGSLEFIAYADLIGTELAALGYKPVGAAASSDLTVRLDYSVDDGRTVTRSRPFYHGYHPYAYYPSFHRPYFHYPYYYGGHYFGYNQGYTSHTVYNRKLEMDIKRNVDQAMLFEGTVESAGTNKHLNEVMPYLVGAMFADFPGEPGVTQRVRIKLPSESPASTTD